MSALPSIGWIRSARRGSGSERHSVTVCSKRTSSKSCKAFIKRLVDLICFTGDVADWGLAEEYREADKRTSRILKELGLPSERLFVVPGNHDVKRKEAEEIWGKLRPTAIENPRGISDWLAGLEPPSGVDPERCEQILQRTAAFWEWVAKDLRRPDLLPKNNPHQRLGYRIPLTVRGLPLHVIGLDSAWLCGNNDDDGKIALTQGQIDLATTEGGKPLPGFRLALIHHPLAKLPIPVTVTERLLKGWIC
jgi:Calcineurin-like phosphoesterase